MRFADYLLCARLFLCVGKCVLFVGAPGVGKTRLAKLLAGGLGGPVVVSGREGLSFDDLLLRYVVGDGGVEAVPGDLLRAVVGSWLGVIAGYGPLHLVFDEINRCNVDMLLGDLFTALDIEHRMDVPVVKGHALSYVKRVFKDPVEALETLGFDPVELRGAAEEFRKILESCSGLPLPYSFRLIATMNIYDRAQLYRLGYALQRRFATIYIIPPTEEYKVEKIGNKLHSIKDDEIHDGVHKMLTDVDGSIARQAVKELMMHRYRRSLVKYDWPTIIGVEIKEDDVSRAIKEFEGVSRIISYLFRVASVLGIELGLSILVDVMKTYIMSLALSMKDKPIVPVERLADLVVSAIILPQLSAVIPRAKIHVMLGLETSKYINELRRLCEKIKEILGPSSLSGRMIGVLEYEIPVLRSH